MLKRLTIKNFKLLRDVELDIHHTAPTILIGPNASGKSTIIEVLDFLARAATHGLEPALIAHGGMAAIRTVGSAAPVEIYTHWRFGFPEAEHGWDLHWTTRIDAQPGGQFFIASESLRDNNTLLISTSEDGIRTVIDELNPTHTPSQITTSSTLGFEAFVDPTRFKGLAALRNVGARGAGLGSDGIGTFVGTRIHRTDLISRCDGDLHSILRGRRGYRARYSVVQSSDRSC